jgi:hypothetical protein
MAMWEHDLPWWRSVVEREDELGEELVSYRLER